MKPTQIPFTRVGYQQLETDLKAYQLKREQVLVRLQTAREMGDLSENAAYHSAKFELGGIDREIRRLKYLLASGEVVDTPSNGTVTFGRTVTVTDGTRERTFLMVSGYESNPIEQKLSIHSPLGQALVGKKSGDRVEFAAPAGSMTYTIVSVK